MITFENLSEYEFYKSNSCNQSVFAVRVIELNMNQNCKVELFEVLENGESFLDLEPICEVDVWGKYYFPQFIGGIHQWYHKMDDKEDKIQAFADAMKFTIAYALEKAEITTY